MRSIVSISNNSFTNTNATSANGITSALNLSVVNAFNTSSTVATSLPVNSLTTACNSGNALIKSSISSTNEMPSYNPSSTFVLANLARDELIPSSTSLP